MSRLELRKGGKEMKRRLGIIGVLIISISLFYGCAGVEVAKAPEPPTEAQETGELKTFEVKADNYKFNPDTITVNKGDKVIIKAIAIDKDHGIGIKAFNINQPLPKGELITIEFTADKKGEFTISCTKFCGWKHFKMKGKLIVK